MLICYLMLNLAKSIDHVMENCNLIVSLNAYWCGRSCSALKICFAIFYFKKHMNIIADWQQQHKKRNVFH